MTRRAGGVSPLFRNRAFTRLARQVKEVSDGEKHSANREKNSPENRRERQTLSLRDVPSQEPEAGEDACALVLSPLFDPEKLGHRLNTD
jgi:hypothetical protein